MDFTRATELTPEVEAAIDDAFEYHKWTPAQVEAGSNIRAALAGAVKAVIAGAPPSPDRTTAIRKIREARMDANSAITHGEANTDDDPSRTLRSPGPRAIRRAGQRVKVAPLWFGLGWFVLGFACGAFISWAAIFVGFVRLGI